MSELKKKPRDEAITGLDDKFFLGGVVLKKIKIPLPPNVKLAPPQLKMPRASNVAICAEELKNFDNVMNLEPLYVRRSEAEELWEKRHGLPSEK